MTTNNATSTKRLNPNVYRSGIPVGPQTRFDPSNPSDPMHWSYCLNTVFDDPNVSPKRLNDAHRMCAILDFGSSNERNLGRLMFSGVTFPPDAKATCQLVMPILNSFACFDENEICHEMDWPDFYFGDLHFQAGPIIEIFKSLPGHCRTTGVSIASKFHYCEALIINSDADMISEVEFALDNP